MRWAVYIVRCSDGTLYTGSTNALEQRVVRHNAGKGAKYTRSRLPVKLVWWMPVASRSDALRFEAEIKALSRKEKLSLIRSDPEV